ncbi:MAG: Ig-like domain repeat protein [Rhodanobacteraceae bacterium]|nr:Ig-like domain repeat protein [Rhodanobacteraceae bacterium]
MNTSIRPAGPGSLWRFRAMTSLLVFFAVLARLGSAQAALEPSGDPDTAFDSNGVAVSNVLTRATFSDANGVVLLPDGRIVVAGNYDGGGGLLHISVTRYNADGSVDGSFGNGGETKTVIGNNELTNAIARQSDGKLVVIGSTTSSNNESFFVARYTADGALDTATFNAPLGYRVLEIGINTTAGQTAFDRAQAVAIDSNGKIIVGGYADNINGANNQGRDYALARLNTDGSLDTSFDGDGKLLFDLQSSTSTTPRVLALAVDPATNKIYGAGRGSSTQLGLFRLNTNGSLDGTYAGGGLLTTFGGGGADRIQAMKLDSSGRIVASGMRHNGSNFQMTVARFTTTGAFDSTFDGDGWNSVNIMGGQDQCRAIDIQPLDGKIVVSGMADSNGAGLFHMFAARFTTAGALDTTYATAGKFHIDASGTGMQNDSRAGVMQSNNRYLIVGTSYPSGTTTATQITVIRLTTAGALDTSFDSDGIALRQLLGGSPDYGYGVAVQSDGKLVVSGATADAAGTNIVVARYNTNGSLDTTFDTDGLVTTANASYNMESRAVLVQPDGKIIAAGQRLSKTPPSPVHQLIAVRYDTNGAIDNTFDTDGFATANLGTNGGYGYAIARQTDGKILVAGSISDTVANWDFVVARFTTTGALDGTFGSGGVTRIGINAGVDEAKSIAIQSDGKILLGGYSYVGGNQEFAIVRLTTGGLIDNTFDGDGIVVTAIGAGPFRRNTIESIVVRADGMIIAGGTGNDGTPTSSPVFRIARYTAAGALDTNFGTAGVSTYSFGATRFDNMYAMALQRDEKMIGFGSTFLTGGGTDFGLARFNWDDGSIDTTYGTSGQTIHEITAGLDIGYNGIVLPDGKQAVGGLGQQSDLAASRYLADPAPTTPGTPDLATASDSGFSSTDNITNDNTPTFNGSCNIGDTVILRVDGAMTTPLSRAICRSGTYATTTVALGDGVHAITALARNGSPNDTGITAGLNVTIDTVALPVTVSAPLAAADVLPNPTISGTGAEAGATVTVAEGVFVICTATVGPSGEWNCNSMLGQGSHTVSVTQTDIAGNTSTPVTRQFRVKLATTTAVLTNQTPSVFGQPVTFTANVTASGGTPDGSVGFVIDGGTPTNVALTAGSATLMTSSLSVGSHTLAVSYDGSTGYFGSNSTLSGGQVVNKANSLANANSSSTAIIVGASVTYSVAVTAVAPGAGTPTSNVSFNDNGIPIPGCSAVALVAGTASCGPLTPAVGSHPITVVYAGDGNFNGVTSTTVTVTVAPAAPSAPLLDPASDSGTSSSDNITNALMPNFMGNCTNGDSLQLRDGGSTVGAAQTCAGNVWAVAVSLAEGVRNMTATTTRNGVTSAPSTPTLLVTIDRSVLAPVITSPVGPVPANPTVGGSGEAGATVTVREGTTTLCTATVAAGSTWSCATTLNGTGTHVLTSTQTDVAGNTSVASAPFNVEIDQLFVNGFEL